LVSTAYIVACLRRRARLRRRQRRRRGLQVAGPDRSSADAQLVPSSSKRASGCLGQAAQDDLLDRRRDQRRQPARRRRRLRDLLDQHGAHGLAVERHLPAQHLEQQHAERVDVGAVIDLLALARLGRHVLRRPEDDAGGGEVLRAALGHHLGQAEIEQLDERRITAPLEQHHVVGLEVAVDDPGGVGRRQRVGDLCAHVQRPRHVEEPLAGQHLRQGLAVEVLHHEEQIALG
jgi:hypothetical protein